MKHNKKLEKIFKYFFFTLFIAYIAFYLSSVFGYYEYSNNKKMILTKENVEKFEQDVKEGKDLSIENYLEKTNKNYQNKASSMGFNVSKKIGEGATIVIDYAFKVLSKIFDE